MKLTSSCRALTTYPMRPTNGGPLNSESLNLPGLWAVEPKLNGWRAMLHVPTGFMYNRHGDGLNIMDEYRGSEAEELIWGNAPPECVWLDCEFLSRRHDAGKGDLVVFDWAVEGLTYTERKEALAEWLPYYFDPSVPLTHRNPAGLLAKGPDISAFALWETLQMKNKELGCDFYEGVVLKKTNSMYEHQLVSPSRSTGAWIKHRFDQYKENE